MWRCWVIVSIGLHTTWAELVSLSMLTMFTWTPPCPSCHTTCFAQFRYKLTHCMIFHMIDLCGAKKIHCCHALKSKGDDSWKWQGKVDEHQLDGWVLEKLKKRFKATMPHKLCVEHSLAVCSQQAPLIGAIYCKDFTTALGIAKESRWWSLTRR